MESKEVVSLREHFERRLLDERHISEERFRAQEQAIAVATKELERRLDLLNESRKALEDQTRTYVTKAEHDRVREDIGEIKAKYAPLSHAERNTGDIRILENRLGGYLTLAEYTNRHEELARDVRRVDAVTTGLVTKEEFNRAMRDINDKVGRIDNVLSNYAGRLLVLSGVLVILMFAIPLILTYLVQ